MVPRETRHFDRSARLYSQNACFNGANTRIIHALLSVAIFRSFVNYYSCKDFALGVQIINYPHPTLRHVSKPLKRVDAELRSIIHKMFELMYEHQGIGLAANQVDLPYRMFVINPQGKPEAAESEQVFINPVLSQPKGRAEAEEGCLSIPNVYGNVVRAEKITVNAYSLEGEEVRAEVDGLLARVIQHETDHLDGRLFVDRLSPTGQMTVHDALAELEIEFQSKRERNELPDDQQIAQRLQELEQLRT